MSDEHEETSSELDLMLGGLGEVESTGSFTMAADRAIDKLAKFQLPDPRIWLVKIYQAAHCAGVESININGGMKGLSIEFPLPEDWSISKLEEALLSPHISKDPALYNLVVGLRSAVLSQGMLLRMSTRSEDKPTSSFQFTSSSLSHLEEANEIGENSVQILLKRSVSLTAWKKEKNFLLRRAASQMMLRVDGEVQNPQLEPYKLEGKLFGSIQSSFAFDQGTAPDNPNVRYLFWDHNGQEPPDTLSYLAWVKDGAIVKSMGASEGLGFTLQLLLSADDLETDLTGWQLREDDRTEDRIEKAIESGVSYLKAKSESASTTLRYPRELLAKRRFGAGVGALVALFCAAVLRTVLPQEMEMAFTSSYYLWFTAHSLMLACPWISAGLILKLLGTIRKEKSLIRERQKDLNAFTEHIRRT